MYVCRLPASLVDDASDLKQPEYVGIATCHPADSLSPDDILVYTPAEWLAFLDGTRQSEFDDLVR